MLTRLAARKRPRIVAAPLATARPMKPVNRLLTIAAIFLAVAGLYRSGQLDFLENKLIDARFALTSRPPSGDVVVVAIDPESLGELGVWPWPRTFHAAAVDQLSWIGAARIAFDIDFSAHSVPANDQALAEVLATASPPVILPAFMQFARQAAGPNELVLSVPLDSLRRSAELASVNFQPEADGVVRQFATSYPWQDGRLPTLPAVLAGAGAELPERFAIDFGIDIGAIPQIRFTDLLHGRVDPRLLAGKRVVIGATAVELGDNVIAPVWRTISGVVLQAAATESILQDRMLQRVDPLAVLAATLIVTIGTVALFARWSWKRSLAALAALALVAFGAAWGTQLAWPLLLDIVPLLAAAVLGFVAALASRVDDLTWSLLTQSFRLRRQDAFMRQVVENTFDGLVTTDADGLIQSFNPAAERVFLTAADAVLGTPFHRLLSPGMVHDLGGGAPGALLTALAERGQAIEGCGRRLDGRDFPIDLAATEVRDGDLRFFVVVVRDVSARKQAEAEANQAQQRLGDAIESISDGFVLFDEQERLAVSNRRYRLLMAGLGVTVAPGMSFAEITRRLAEQGAPAEGGEGWAAARQARFAQPDGAFEEQLADGRWLRVDERRTADGGSVGIVSDISDLKHRQIELAAARDTAVLASRAKTEFLANMSHELRTPLNAIMGFSEMMTLQMLGPIGNPTYLSYGRDIHSSASHLLAIISDILDISKVEAGKIELSDEAIVVADEVAAALRLVHERADAQQLTLLERVAPGLPQLRGDARLVKQMLLNLLTNAVKFTPPGGRVAVEAALDGEGNLVVDIADTGIGIPADELERVLQPFGQVESAFARQHGGVGLGLPLVKSFVELHGGSLRLISAPGVGTTARLTFPAARILREPELLAAG